MIKSIGLTNFRNHAAFESKLGKRVLITGPNGSGKSTMLDAIQWALLGRCRGVDGRGVGQQDLIRNGADDTGVTIDVGGVGPITRNVTRGGSAKASLKTDMIVGKLRVSEGMLNAVLSGRSFFDMHHAEAKKLLMALLDVQIDPKDLPGLDLDGPVGLDELEARFLAAFEDRKTQKRVLEDIQLPDFTVNPALDKLDLEVLRADAQAANDRLQAAMQAAATARAKVASLTQQVAGLTKELDGRAKIVTTRDVHADMVKQHQGLLDAAKTALAEAEAEVGDSITELQGQINAKKLLVTQLSTHAPDRGCVLSASIPCLTAASAFVDQVKGLEKDVKALAKKLAAGTKRAEGIAAARQRVTDAERQVTYHQNQVANGDRDLADLDARAAKLDDLKAQLKDAEVNPLLEQTIVDTAADEQRQANDKANAAREYQQLKKQRTQAEERQAKQQQKVDTLDSLVTMLGPNGVRGRALQSAVGGFQDLINAALEPFGFTLTFTVEPFRVDVFSPDKGQRRYEMLSAGEQLWTGLAFQVALAVVSGLGFCVLDAAEAVVGENRALLTDLIMTAPIDQVVVAMAKGEDEPDPDIEGLQVIRLAGVASAAA